MVSEHLCTTLVSPNQKGLFWPFPGFASGGWPPWLYRCSSCSVLLLLGALCGSQLCRSVSDTDSKSCYYCPQCLFRYFLSSPSGAPSARVVHPYLSSCDPCLSFHFTPSLSLLCSFKCFCGRILKLRVFPQPCPVHRAHQRHSSFLLVFFISDTSFLFFHRISTLLLTFVLACCLFPLQTTEY